MSTSAGRHVEWRLSSGTMVQFREMLAELELTSMHAPRYHQLLDDMKSLPGFPHHADPERDVIHFNVTTERLN